jgi:hypothetical protein
MAMSRTDHRWLAAVAPAEMLNPAKAILVDLIKRPAQPPSCFIDRTEGGLLARLPRPDLGHLRRHHDCRRNGVEGVVLSVSIANLDTLGAAKDRDDARVDSG